MPTTRTIQSLAATSIVVASLKQKVKILNIDGYCNGDATSGAVQYYLLFFNQATVPADTTVPLKSLQVSSSDGFTFNKDFAAITAQNLATPPTAAGNLIIVLSTTKDTLTVGTGNVTMSITVEIEEYELQPVSGQTTTTGSGAATITPWATGSGPKHLIDVTVTNLEATANYIMLFADTPTTGDYPIMSWPIAATGDSNGLDTQILEFGIDGLVPDAQTSAGVYTKGCVLGMSTTTPTYTAASGSKANWTAHHR